MFCLPESMTWQLQDDSAKRSSELEYRKNS